MHDNVENAFLGLSGKAERTSFESMVGMTSLDDDRASVQPWWPLGWTLGYEMAGSDDAAWTIRCGDESGTDVYEVTDEIEPDDSASAQRWAEEYLGRVLGRVARWKPHRPDPSASPDYYIAVFEDSTAIDG